MPVDLLFGKTVRFAYVYVLLVVNGGAIFIQIGEEYAFVI
jgi:hypothetical protein